MTARTDDRVIVLVDMDCFYVQVEERDHPAIRGYPAAVVQYNAHRGGGIIAVNYEARAAGVKRGMRGSDATDICPGIHLVRVPMQRDKANLQKYRNAGKEVISVLCGFSDTVERASIDEAYLDLTQVIEQRINGAADATETKTRKDGINYCIPQDVSMNKLAVTGNSEDNSEEGNTRNIPTGELLADTAMKDAVTDDCDATIDYTADIDESSVADTLAPNYVQRRSLLSLIPSIDQLKSTWVKLPDACDGLLHNEAINAVSDEEHRKKYELDETIPSQWVPESSSRAVQEVAESVTNKEAAEDTPMSDAYHKGADEIAAQEKEAARLRDLTVWLTSLRRRMLTPDIPDQLADGAFHDLRLIVAAELCEEIRAAVLQTTGFKCSAGIAHNKVLAKLVCGLHKPDQQTVIPGGSVAALWRNTPLNKVRNLGGKLGESVTHSFGCRTMAELGDLSLVEMRGRYDDKTALWLYNLGRGLDSEAVVSRQQPKSVGCSKNFLGRESLNTRHRVEHWTRMLAEELAERLQEDQQMNKRVARTLTVGCRQARGPHDSTNSTRCCPIPAMASDKIAAAAVSLLMQGNTAKQHDQWFPSILNISLSASKFEDSLSSGMVSISELFKKVAQRQEDQSTSSGYQPSAQSPEVVTRTVDAETVSADDVLRPRGIKAYFTEDPQGHRSPEISSARIHKTTSDITGFSNNQKRTDDHYSNPANSFFKKFLLKKKLSTETSSSHKSVKAKTDADTVRTASTVSMLSITDDESCDAAIDVLAELLDDSGDENGEKEKTLTEELKRKPIILSLSSRDGKKPNTVDESIYDSSTDEDSELLVMNKTGNTKSSSANLLCSTPKQIQKDYEDAAAVTRGTHSSKTQTHDTKSPENKTDSKAPSVAELFPDLSEVDESLLPHLPPDLRRAVMTELAKYKAQHAGKQIAKKTGMWKYMTMENCIDPRQVNVDKKQTKISFKNFAVDTEEQYDVAAPQSVNETKLQNLPSTSKNKNASCIHKFMDGFESYNSSNKKSTDSQSFTKPTALMELGNGHFQCEISSFKTGQQNCTSTSMAVDNGSNCAKDTNINAADLIQCDRCREFISLTIVAEHMDYHVALDIQEQIMGNSSNRSTDNKSTLNKRTKRKMAKVSTTKNKRNRTIDSFFNK